MADADAFSLLSVSPPTDASHSLENVFDEYTSHMSSPVSDFDTWFVSTLRQHHPGYTITATPTPLISYASLGHAKAEHDLDDANVLRWRLYLPAFRRGMAGSLGDTEFFAKYKYLWQGEQFIVYAIRMGYTTVYYILKEPDKERHENEFTHCLKTDLLLLAIGEYADALHHEILVYDGYWQKSAQLWQEVQKSTWDQVILDEEMKKTLTTTVERFFDSKETYKELDVPWKRGLIFHGPAGNGKTISLKALMHSLSVRHDPIPTLYVKSMSYTFDIRAVFTKARQMAPCLLIIEDIDTVIGAANRSYFFNEVDGLEDNDGILMIATTNHLDRLDPGLSKRPSRFDRKYKFSLPTRSERILYCDFWRKKLSSNKSIQFPKKLCPAIADITNDFSFAYLKEAFVATLLVIAGQENEDPDSDEEKDETDYDDEPDLDDLVLWVEMKKQVKLLREDMDGGDDVFSKIWSDIPATPLKRPSPPPKPTSLPVQRPSRIPGAWPGPGMSEGNQSRHPGSVPTVRFMDGVWHQRGYERPAQRACRNQELSEGPWRMPDAEQRRIGREIPERVVSSALHGLEREMDAKMKVRDVREGW